MNLKFSPLIASIAAAGVLLGGCSGGGNGSSGIPATTSKNPIPGGKLSFAVGTANIAGTSGLNVVAIYRAGNGLSNSLVNTPTITGPFTFTAAAVTAPAGAAPFSTIPGGPSTSEATAGGTIMGTPQTVHQGTTPSAANETSFGQSGGVFTNSIAPANSTVNGVPYTNVPYGIDVYGLTALAGDPANAPWGGPPAFDPDKNGMGLRDGLNNLGAGVLGIPEGFTTFEGVTPSAGAYKLSVAVPTGFSGSTPQIGTVTASATLASTAKLPTLTAPAIALDGGGGGTITLPAADFTGGITEVYIQVIDTGNGATNCQGPRGATGGAGPVYYTVIAKAAGPYTLPDTDGPNTNTTGGPSGLTPSPSICTVAQNTAANGGTASPGDNYEVYVVGTDYDMYGATFPITNAQAPTITGAAGQSDITVSAPLAGTST